jgi:hypothetical protein
MPRTERSLPMLEESLTPTWRSLPRTERFLPELEESLTPTWRSLPRTEYSLPVLEETLTATWRSLPRTEQSLTKLELTPAKMDRRVATMDTRLEGSRFTMSLICRTLPSQWRILTSAMVVRAGSACSWRGWVSYWRRSFWPGHW